MKKKLSYLVGLSLLLLNLQAFAQGELKFEKDNHDFGNVTEGTQATYEFKFTNTGNQPVIISNVQASCGCTTPEWTKDPVLPGKTGKIKAVYNSAGRPGSFSKSITVTSNAATPTKVLYIKGMVQNKEQAKAEYTPEQKAQSPRLAVASTNYNFGKLEKGQRAHTKFTVKNTGRQDLVITNVKSNCNCVSFKVTPEAIKPGQQGTLELFYVPRMLKEQNEVVTIESNDIVSDNLKITLKADVVENLASPNMLKESSSAVPFR
ncbi:MAG: DUF1573 domain-containing protein [Hymenobacteraceae bacterium]|nr:DUF1573 domain-containing protein [Hymenobacteraceae bacterium]MDX5397320.1 DUF1573 domain-containing protein [Hymenobacteraceae bacterium]MDX5513398.1 DUF1573 domain-containing protein [Hymenobacteraceae bacterium]